MLEHEVYEFLKSRFIEVPQYKLFNLDEALDVDFYPAVLKIESQKVIHKTELGAVLTGLQNREELETAKSRILANLSNHGIRAEENDKFLVTRMYSGIELFFGIIHDPVFEKVIVFGAGGIFAELFKDVCFIDSESDEGEIVNAISQTKIGTLFSSGFRGKKYDIRLVVDFIKKLQLTDVQEMDLNPVILAEDSLTVVDARILISTGNPGRKKIKYIPEIFTPEKIAIIGVSAHPEKVGYALAGNAAEHSGVYFVNPGIDLLFGKKVYNSVEDLPFIDTAILAIPAPSVKETLQKLAILKVRNIIIITAGFRESGVDESFLTEFAAVNHINIIGPNCLGIFANGINLSFGTNKIESGNANLFSQSGAIVAELMDKAVLKNIGFENIISVGNMADVDFGDLINSYSGSNPINLYIEGISNGKNLLRAIRKSHSQIKVYKGGKTEIAKKAAFSHTGNMAGNYEMFVGLLRNSGAKILQDVNGLLYPYHFEKIIIITNAGGGGTVMSDMISNKLYSLNQTDISNLSKVLPANWSKNNPVDIIGDAGQQRYLDAITVADRFGADAIFVIITPQFMTHAEKISRIFTDYTFKTKIFPVILGGEMMETAKKYLQENRIVFFEEINEAVSFL